MDLSIGASELFHFVSYNYSLTTNSRLFARSSWLIAFLLRLVALLLQTGQFFLDYFVLQFDENRFGFAQRLTSPELLAICHWAVAGTLITPSPARPA